MNSACAVGLREGLSVFPGVCSRCGVLRTQKEWPVTITAKSGWEEESSVVSKKEIGSEKLRPGAFLSPFFASLSPE